MTADSSLEGGTSSSDRSSTLWSEISLVSVAVIWGVNIPLMKIGLDRIDPYVFNAVRLTVSALVLNLFAWREFRRGASSKPSVSFRELCLFSAMIAAVYQVLFLVGVNLTTSGNTALIMATVPMWTALLARIFIHEQLRKIAWWGLTVALVGTAIVAFQNDSTTLAGSTFLGNCLILGAALTWSGGTVYSKPLLHRISPLQLSAYAAALALPVHLMIAVGRYEQNLPALQSSEMWLIILYSGVFSSGLTLPMWNYGVRHAGPAHASVIQNLIPLVAIIAAWLIRDEPVTSAQALGGVLILGGVIMVRQGKHHVLRASDLSTEEVSE